MQQLRADTHAALREVPPPSSRSGLAMWVVGVREAVGGWGVALDRVSLLTLHPPRAAQRGRAVFQQRNKWADPKAGPFQERQATEVNFAGASEA